MEVNFSFKSKLQNFLIQITFTLRWGQLNGTELDRQGEVGEGTSIDFEEPVVITIQCDGDGWVMQVKWWWSSKWQYFA